MSELPTCICAPRRKTMNYGRNIVRIQTGRPQRPQATFIIHEDLICSKSRLFRAKLQPKRKPIEDDCSICHEELQQGVKELTFCSTSCGNNFHYGCIERSKEQLQDPAAFKCPICRENWATESNTISTHHFEEFITPTFEIYVEWLYHGQIGTEPHQSGDPEYYHLFDGYLLGLQVQDISFCKAVLRRNIEVVKHYGDPDIRDPYVINGAYDMTVEGSPLRRIIVLNYISRAHQNWFDKDKYPAAFLQDFVQALLTESPGRRTFDVEQVRNELRADEGYENDVAHF